MSMQSGAHDSDSSGPTGGTATASRPHLSFLDGDIALRSQDGVDFRVDMAILRRASPFWEDAFRIGPNTTYNQSEPIFMMESAEVLDNVLRLIYPTASPPTLNSIPHALELFKAVERLQIKTYAIDNFAANYLSTVEPCLRAWAIAARFHYTKARKEAVRRYLGEMKDNMSVDIRELDMVGARSLVKLMRVKHDAIAHATRAIMSDSFVWYCPHHVNLPWRINHANAIKANPFDPLPRSDSVLAVIIRLFGCPDCLRRFQHSSTALPRSMVSRSILALLELATVVEAQEDDSDGSSTSIRLKMPPLPPPPGPLPPGA
jgi:hypothetical protein